MACRGAMVDDYCWLPEEFPEEVFFLGEQEEKVSNRVTFGRAPARGALQPPPLLSCFPSEFPYDIDSSLSPSPLGSAAGTDSDEDDYEDLLAAGLAQKLMMARSFRLSEAEEAAAAAAWPPSSSAGQTQNKITAGMRQQQYSPQSTLSPAGSWTAFGGVGGGGSPTDPDYLFRASRKREDTALDLLSAAAMEVERMRLKDGIMLRRALAAGDNGRGLLPGPGTHRKNGNGTVAGGTLNSKNTASSGYYGSNPQQVQASQPQQRTMAAPGTGTWGGARQNGTRPASSPYTGPPSTWSLPVPPPQNHHQQQQHRPLGGSGMRAVFLGGAGTRRESSGTGVFLPRRDGNPPPAKKKSACSTVLLPARVVQALNLNLDEIGALPVSSSHGAGAGVGAGFVINSEVMRARNHRTTQPQQQQRIPNHAAAAPATTHRYPTNNPHHHHHHHLVSGATKPTASTWSQEIRLPPEWSY